jgi:hypothetical protein
MVVAVVTPVVFCPKATEKSNKNTKISRCLPKNLFITIYCKTYYNSYIANSSVAQARCMLLHGRSPNQHYGPIQGTGYHHRKALVIARMINAL